MTNILDDFYLPLLEQEKHYLSKEYKLLKKNKIDTAEFDGFEKDRNAGEVQFTEATEDNKKEEEGFGTKILNTGKDLIGGMFD